MTVVFLKSNEYIFFNGIVFGLNGIKNTFDTLSLIQMLYFCLIILILIIAKFIFQKI